MKVLGRRFSEAHIQEVKLHLLENMRKTASYCQDKPALIYKLKIMAFIKLEMEVKHDADSDEPFRVTA